jgi:hypoxanthine-DNA glycosylase
MSDRRSVPASPGAQVPVCIGLPPIVAGDAHTLVLGSMPGARSLALQQYYAHPRNAFWKIMGALCDAPVETYEQRVALIAGNRLALWDTLKCCVRPGSLDSRIASDGMEVNDFASFFRGHPGVRRVFFNGSKSEQEFRRRVMPALSEAVKAGLAFARLPSTSPAHAGRSFAEKLALWRVVRDF